jgi:hypothetical protein
MTLDHCESQNLNDAIQPNPLESRIEFYVNFLVFPSLQLHGFEPSGVTGKHFGALDFPNHQAVRHHQPQCGLKLGDSADKDGLRPAGSILQEPQYPGRARRPGEPKWLFWTPVGRYFAGSLFVTRTRLHK